MIYLNLQKDKILKANQSTLVYEGENLADEIKITIDEDYYKDKDCYLVILTTTEEAGDTIKVKNGDSYWLDNRYLTQAQDLIVWIDIRENDTLMKSSEVILKVNKHHKIEEIITDVEISLFEQILAETKEIQKNLEEGFQKLETISSEPAKKEDILELFK